MNIAICDDENEFCQKIKNALIGTINKEDTIECFDNGEHLIACSSINPYDIVYLDIEMPGIDGIKTAERLQQINRGILIIFVTSHHCYISDAFKLNAFQFLIKELASEEEIVLEYNRAKEKYKIEHYLYSIKRKDAIEKIEINKIVYLESNQRHLYAVTVDGNKCEFRGKISEEAKKLKMFNFVRIHESLIVNMAYIRRIEPASVTLKYSNDECLPVSRRYKCDLTNEYNLYVLGCSI